MTRIFLFFHLSWKSSWSLASCGHACVGWHWSLSLRLELSLCCWYCTVLLYKHIIVIVYRICLPLHDRRLICRSTHWPSSLDCTRPSIHVRQCCVWLKILLIHLVRWFEKTDLLERILTLTYSSFKSNTTQLCFRRLRP